MKLPVFGTRKSPEMPLLPDCCVLDDSDDTDELLGGFENLFGRDSDAAGSDDLVDRDSLDDFAGFDAFDGLCDLDDVDDVLGDFVMIFSAMVHIVFLQCNSALETVISLSALSLHLNTKKRRPPSYLAIASRAIFLSSPTKRVFVVNAKRSPLCITTRCMNLGLVCRTAASAEDSAALSTHSIGCRATRAQATTNNKRTILPS